MLEWCADMLLCVLKSVPLLTHPSSSDHHQPHQPYEMGPAMRLLGHRALMDDAYVTVTLHSSSYVTGAGWMSCHTPPQQSHTGGMSALSAELGWLRSVQWSAVGR